MKNKSHHLSYFGLVLAVFLFDQISKFIIVKHLPLGEIKVFTNWFNLVFRQNRGVSFGFFPAHNFYAKMLLIGLILGLMIWVIYQLWHSQKRLESFGYAFILGGAVGNLFDRFYREGVVDFLEFHLDQYYWPAFNVADSFIVIGALLIFMSQTWQSCGQLKTHKKIN